MHDDQMSQARRALGHHSVEETDAYAMPALEVACPSCGSAPGELCTSHGGTRTRRHNVHQTRTAAHHAAQQRSN